MQWPQRVGEPVTGGRQKMTQSGEEMELDDMSEVSEYTRCTICDGSSRYIQ